MENKIAGNYLFVVYDCNDIATYKVIRRQVEFCSNQADIDELAKLFLETSSEATDTAFVEIWKHYQTQNNWK